MIKGVIVNGSFKMFCVIGSDVDETKVDLKIKNHAFDLSLKLEAASAFNKISTLSVHSGQDYALCMLLKIELKCVLIFFIFRHSFFQ